VRELVVAFTSDTEDNHPSYVPGWHNFGSDYDVKEGVLRWDWREYFSDLSNLFRKKEVPVTWLIRIDKGPMQDRMIDLFAGELSKLRFHGDEIGIHIHTFVWDERLSKWVQTTDPKFEAEIVYHSVGLFKNRLGFDPSSVRMGWFTMSNEIMKTLETCGLQVDASALPGASSFGKFNGRDNIFDWSRAPSIPYHPHQDDYQSPGNMKILEIPIAGITGGAPGAFGGIVNRLSGMKSLVKLLPVARLLKLTPHRHLYITPYWSSSQYSKIVKDSYARNRPIKTGFVVASFHACDILDPARGNINMRFQRYLMEVIEELSSLKNASMDVTFTTLSEMARRVKETDVVS
jgi:hypothetical protein